MTNKIINCDLHDYLEIACCYNYHIEITLKNGSSFTGFAKTTLTEKNQKEFLIYYSDENQSNIDKIEMNMIAKLVVISKNSVFSEVNFITGEKS